MPKHHHCKCKKPCLKKVQTYYLNVDEFITNMISSPTTNVSEPSGIVDSRSLAGRAELYDAKTDLRKGTCSATFLCMQTENIFVDIVNYIALDNGLIVSWLTPTTCANLELDTIVNSLVSECLVESNTKIGFNPYYGKTFDLKVKSKNGRIYFKFKLLCDKE
jgi:hypothetical protein